MTGVITRHPEEPYANNARTVPWEVLGATRAPTRLGVHMPDIEPWMGDAKSFAAHAGLDCIRHLTQDSVARKRAPSSWALLLRACSAAILP